MSPMRLNKFVLDVRAADREHPFQDKALLLIEQAAIETGLRTVWVGCPRPV